MTFYVGNRTVFSILKMYCHLGSTFRRDGQTAFLGAIDDSVHPKISASYSIAVDSSQFVDFKQLRVKFFLNKRIDHEKIIGNLKLNGSGSQCLR